jgi:probable rRNA maturation factor
LIAIQIANRQKAVLIDRNRIRRLVRAVLKDADISEARISIAIVDDPTIARLHREFLHDPEPTDVLSFVLEQSPRCLEGEVVASADTAAASARQFGCTAEDELLLYVLHGALHLVGYDDTAPKLRRQMRAKEQEYLAASKPSR